MDITPLYELKTHLRAAAIAGTSLLSENFRLKKAAESFKALESASPVFKKISEQTDTLLSDDCADKPGALLDVITLADSVICTLGATEAAEELSELPIMETGSEIVNVPYSRLSAVIDALTKSGSGNMEIVSNTWLDSPELFRDFRVKPALVKGLGASYSELADSVTDIVINIGSEMLPLLKKDFDPNGKKEMQRRITTIEKINGANESEFFIEQFEHAEKDVRSALIYALRHNECNTDKLIELCNSEKGKQKTAALSALMSFDNGKAAAFFDEYSKKKSDEVLQLLSNVSSEWSSGLAARLIDESLYNEKGERVTLSQVMSEKLTLKNKIDRFHLLGALWGKFGGSIEKIYREFYDESRDAWYVDLQLGDTIAATGNESLKKLAVELNNDSPMKGRYIFAETVTRLLSGEDCSEFIREQVRAVYEAQKFSDENCTDEQKKKAADMYDFQKNFERAISDTEILKVLRKIRFENGRYVFNNAKYDSISGGWILNEPLPLDQPIKGAITDILMEFPCWQFDRVLESWFDKSDREYCEKLGKFYIERFVSKSGELGLLMHLRNLDMRNVKGLARRFCESHPQDNRRTLKSLFFDLCGDSEYKLSEAREIVELLKSGKLKMDMNESEIEQFSSWVENDLA